MYPADLISAEMFLLVFDCFFDGWKFCSWRSIEINRWLFVWASSAQVEHRRIALLIISAQKQHDLYRLWLFGSAVLISL